MVYTLSRYWFLPLPFLLSGRCSLYQPSLPSSLKSAFLCPQGSVLSKGPAHETLGHTRERRPPSGLGSSDWLCFGAAECPTERVPSPCCFWEWAAATRMSSARALGCGQAPELPLAPNPGPQFRSVSLLKAERGSLGPQGLWWQSRRLEWGAVETLESGGQDLMHALSP